MRAIGAGLFVLLLAACGGVQHANKSGASADPAVTLRLVQVEDSGDIPASYFADAVARRSGGSVKVELDSRRRARLPAANELALARDVRAGRVGLGYLPARVWAREGAPAFEALLAPFAITTFRTADALAAGRVGRALLKTLPSSLVGVALVPSEPRRILASTRPVTRKAFAGLRMYVNDNPRALGLRALGARPVEGACCAGAVPPEEARHALANGLLNAVEASLSDLVIDDDYEYVKHLSGYSIYPRFQSIVVSRRAWDRLTADQRSAIRQAALDTVHAAGRAVPERERFELRVLCWSKVNIAVPTMSQLNHLRRAVRPSIEALRADGAAASALAAIRSLPLAGPRPLAAPIPAACRSVGRPEPVRPRPGEATIPDGVYATTDTVKDWREVDLTKNPDFRVDVTYVTRIRDGRWYQFQLPGYSDQGPWSGVYEFHGTNTVTFTMLRALGGQLSAPDTVKWSYFNGELYFEPGTPDPNSSVNDPSARVMWFAHPWRKIG